MKKKFSIAVLLLGGLGLASLSCSKNKTETPVPVVQADTVYIDGSAFSPDSLTVGLGRNVTWINNDAAVHKVVATDGSFNSGDLPKGGRFTHTFTTLGEHNYVCQYHISSRGKVLVSSR